MAPEAQHVCSVSSPGSSRSTASISSLFTSAEKQTSATPLSPKLVAVSLCKKSCWQPDAEAPNCNLCSVAFSMLRRRHHCRRCGKIFCSDCAPRANKSFRLCRICKDSPDISSPSSVTAGTLQLACLLLAVACTTCDVSLTFVVMLV